MRREVTPFDPYINDCAIVLFWIALESFTEGLRSVEHSLAQSLGGRGMGRVVHVRVDNAARDRVPDTDGTTDPDERTAR
ncbi:hypothetical protein SGFS_015960 [Streptomyces graminofaciens]|uniref:Uncharacterized protein n=1 Tax=Streptomyces graminofaciens TaxID=68212 RepID=A0ABM7F3C0_9ACTN|nr:hypothetical protein SGFS_015960 [Streptomyces graminofaciens]